MKLSLYILFICILLFQSGYAQNELEKVSSINSSSNDQNPMLNPSGSRLFFIRKRHPQNTGGISDEGDIWYSKRQADSSWSSPVNFKELNNKFFNSIVGFSDDGSIIYLHGHYINNGKKPTTQGVSYTTKQGNGWSKPKPIKIPYFYNKSDHQSGSMHYSGQVMLLSIQSYDSKGAEDLYVSFKKADNSWSEPMNLGNDINTPYQEMTPFLAADGKTLFFASNGYETFGSRDIFSSVRLDDSWQKWSNPKNLGARINTEGTELYYNISPDSEFAYLSSTQNSEGLADINRIDINPEEQFVEDVVAMDKNIQENLVIEEQPSIDSITRQEDNEQVNTQNVEVKSVKVQGQVSNNKDAAAIASAVTAISMREPTTDTIVVMTDNLGNYSLELNPEDDYQIYVESEGFIRTRDNIFISQQAPIDNSDVIVRNYALIPIEIGTTVNLENVLFDRGTAEMLSGSEETLDEVVLFLNENPSLEIEVSGHTDDRGRADLNLTLSKARAEAVKRYLVDQGNISSSRIQDVGYGGTKPIASNAIEEERRKNRRVEFTILKK